MADPLALIVEDDVDTAEFFSQVLTAANTLADEDGLGAVSYQWQRDGVDIASATASSYTLTQTDVGTTITVVAGDA